MTRCLVLLLWCWGVPAFADCGADIREEVGSAMPDDVLPEGLAPATREVLWLIGARETRLSLTPPRGAAGERGAWQVLPSTARPYLNEGERLADVRVNARVAAEYFQDLLELSGGDYFLAVAAYNHGPKAIARMRARKEIPKVTANYLVYVIQLAKESHCEEILSEFVRLTPVE